MKIDLDKCEKCKYKPNVLAMLFCGFVDVDLCEVCKKANQNLRQSEYAKEVDNFCDTFAEVFRKLAEIEDRICLNCRYNQKLVNDRFVKCSLKNKLTRDINSCKNFEKKS